MKKIIALSVIVSACGSSNSGNDSKPVYPPSDRPINPNPSPTPLPKPEPLPGQRIKYKPTWLSAEWSDSVYYLTHGGEPGNYGILPGEEPIADSMFRYFEGIRAFWKTSVNHGVVPYEYLQSTPKTPDGIIWTDGTGGKIPGFEKLRPVLGEMTTRCPSLADPTLQAPLEVVWADNDTIRASGQFWNTWFSLTWESDSVRIDANMNAVPKINVRAEYIKDYGNGFVDGYKYPKQTFKEITGGKSWAEGGYTWKSIDQTLAHEYGHFLIQAWAYNHGRSNIQSQWFAEGFAEFVKINCRGFFYDDPSWIQNEIRMNTPWDGGLPFSNMEDIYRKSDHRFSRESEYDLDSLGDLISWESYNNRFEPDIMLKAGILALESMKGRAISSYPVSSPIDGVLTDRSPWANSQDFNRPEIANDVPMILTRSEWLENFCDAYESLGKTCGHMRKVIEADAEGLRRDEW